MKKKNFKKAVCAAMAGLMIALTACGNVGDKPKPPGGGFGGKVTNSTNSQDPAPDPESVPDPEPVSLSAVPLSNETLAAPDGEPDSAFWGGYRDYAAALFANACTEDLKNGKNAMISPESVIMALGMTANGACGETLSQMEAAMGGAGIDQLNNSLNYLADRAANSDKVKFNIANSVWVRDDKGRIQMKQDFCDKLRRLYGADSFLAPFDSTTLADINSWVNNETNGMIPAILDNIPSTAVAYLINAVAFEGVWQEEYKDHQVHENDIFTNAAGEEEQVTLLYSTEDIYLSDDNTSGFLKYYKGYDYAFMALLPDEGIDIADYVSSLDGEKLSNLWNTRRGGCMVFASIPEFTADYDMELKDALMAMGMKLPFTESADFSDMAATGSGALYIDRVLHKTHIEVDRTGTKAAAATAIQMTDEADVEIVEDFYTVYLDRPFVYAIVDTESGIPLFIGAVNTVK